jgi:hypothetical protein
MVWAGRSERQSDMGVPDRYPQRAAAPSSQTKEHEHTLEKINKEGNAERSVLAFLSTNTSSNFSAPAVKEGIK